MCGVRWENWWFSWLGKCVGFVVVWFGCGEKDWWLYSVALPIGKFSFLHFASHKHTQHKEKPQVLLLKKYPLFLHLWQKGKTFILNKIGKEKQFSMVVPCCDLCFFVKIYIYFIF